MADPKTLDEIAEQALHGVETVQQLDQLSLRTAQLRVIRAALGEAVAERDMRESLAMQNRDWDRRLREALSKRDMEWQAKIDAEGR